MLQIGSLALFEEIRPLFSLNTEFSVLCITENLGLIFSFLWKYLLMVILLQGSVAISKIARKKLQRLYPDILI